MGALPGCTQDNCQNLQQHLTRTSASPLSSHHISSMNTSSAISWDFLKPEIYSPLHVVHQGNRLTKLTSIRFTYYFDCLYFWASIIVQLFSYTKMPILLNFYPISSIICYIEVLSYKKKISRFIFCINWLAHSVFLCFTTVANFACSTKKSFAALL